MGVEQLIPIIIPAFFIQLSLQVFYIKQCWDSKYLSQDQKIRYIIFMMLFNLPFIAFYLFKMSKHEKPLYNHQETHPFLRQGIFVLTVLAFEIFVLSYLFTQLEHPNYFIVAALFGLVFVGMIVHEGLWILKKTSYTPLVTLMLLVLIFASEFVILSSEMQLIGFVVFVSIYNTHTIKSLKKMILPLVILYFCISAFKSYLIYGSLSGDELISYLYMNVLVFVLISITFYTLKKQMIVNPQLILAIDTLNSQAKQIEQMTTLAERQRIAGEIHDHIGHTLTTAIISIEAGEKLFEHQHDKALEKFLLAKAQVKTGLNDIRSLVSTESSMAHNSFIDNLNDLIHQIKINTSLKIHLINESECRLLPIQQRTLISCIKEFTTNSLKHGQSTEIDILIQTYQDMLSIALSNNGLANKSFEMGYGLSHMKQSIESLGGRLMFQTDIEEGFGLILQLPLGITPSKEV